MCEIVLLQGDFGGPDIDVLCDKPVTENKGVADVSSDKINGYSWPVCAQLDCVCLGDERLKTCNHDRSECTERSTQVLRFECNSTTNFESFVDVTGKSYIIPKVENCGTYKPESPSWRSRCLCPELPERK